MATKLELVIKGFRALNSADQAKLLQVIQVQGRGSLAEGVMEKALRVDMGPVSDSCPCCGR